MKHLLIIGLMLATALSFGQNVDIPDPVLKNRLVSDFDANNDGEISFTEAEFPFVVNVSGIGFSDMTGLEAFVNVENLFAAVNTITDLTPILNHPSVRNLDLSNNRIAALPDLSGMTALTSLNVSSNVLTEIPNLQNTGLHSLTVSFNQITAIDPLNLPADLITLDISVNPIDVFPDLTGMLSLASCSFSSIDTPVDGDLLPSALLFIYMPFNDTTGWSTFQHLTQLEELRATDCEFSGVLDLSVLTNLRLLELGRNQITNVTGLENLLLLTDLDLSSNQLTSLASLNNLISLESLDLGSNLFTTLPDLSMLSQLEDLFVDGNQLTELPPLPLNGALRGINCTENLLTSLPDLSDLPQLSFLYANSNQLTDLSDLVIPETIVDLGLSYNQIGMPPILPPTEGFRNVNLDWNFLTTMEGLAQSPETSYSALFNLLDETSCPWFTNSSSTAYEKQGHAPYANWLEVNVSILEIVSIISVGYSSQTYTLICE